MSKYWIIVESGEIKIEEVNYYDTQDSFNYLFVTSKEFFTQDAAQSFVDKVYKALGQYFLKDYKEALLMVEFLARVLDE